MEKELRKSSGMLDVIRSRTLTLVDLGEVGNRPVPKFSILGGSIPASIMRTQLMNVASFILAILSIGFISLRIGFIHKSVSATLVSAILLDTTLGQVIMGLVASIDAFAGIIN